MKIIEYVLAKKQKIITPGQNVSTLLTINSHYTTHFLRKHNTNKYSFVSIHFFSHIDRISLCHKFVLYYRFTIVFSLHTRDKPSFYLYFIFFKFRLATRKICENNKTDYVQAHIDESTVHLHIAVTRNTCCVYVNSALCLRQYAKKSVAFCECIKHETSRFVFERIRV